MPNKLSIKQEQRQQRIISDRCIKALHKVVSDLVYHDVSLSAQDAVDAAGIILSMVVVHGPPKRAS